MDLQALGYRPLYRPTAASGTSIHAGEMVEELNDQFKPSGAVATPAELPRPQPGSSIESDQGVYKNLANDGARFKNGQLFVPASAVKVEPGFENDSKAQCSWLTSQSQQRFGLSIPELMSTEVGQAHFVGMAEEWRLAHPTP